MDAIKIQKAGIQMLKDLIQEIRAKRVQVLTVNWQRDRPPFFSENGFQKYDQKAAFKATYIIKVYVKRRR